MEFKEKYDSPSIEIVTVMIQRIICDSTTDYVYANMDEDED